jgi:hypothetical protein
LDLMASDRCGRNGGFVQPWGIPQTSANQVFRVYPKWHVLWGKDVLNQGEMRLIG